MSVSARIAALVLPLLLGLSNAVLADSADRGTFVARIILTQPGEPSVAASAVSVLCVRSDTQATVGLASIGAPMESGGVRYVPLKITGLPLGVEIAIAVVTKDPNPLPTGFVHLMHFRPKTGAIGSETLSITLDAAHASNSDSVDFVPYTLEVPPLPPPSTASPAQSPASRV